MRTFYCTLILIVLAGNATACDFCGCSSGNYFMGPFPQFRKYFLGTRYTFRRFSTTLAEDPSQFSKDFYQSAEIWGGLNAGQRWQFLGFIPYNINRQESDDGVSQTSGIGDVTLLANYNVWKSVSVDRVSHRIWIGGGFKLPTGKYAIDPDEANPTANNQPGTGSLDVVTNAMYTLRAGDWAFNVAANYRINQSADGFQFGNRLATSLFVYRSLATLPATFNPTVGLLHENLAPNKLNDVIVESTGGHTLLGAIGLDTNLKRFTVGFNVQLPIAQHYSGGQTETTIRGMAHVTYVF